MCEPGGAHHSTSERCVGPWWCVGALPALCWGRGVRGGAWFPGPPCSTPNQKGWCSGAQGGHGPPVPPGAGLQSPLAGRCEVRPDRGPQLPDSSRVEPRRAVHTLTTTRGEEEEGEGKLKVE